ncbi:MAG: universal stress protein [Winogradskyella sp.]|uniref:universal stress protein n=1 Tax=Winogradskyella sp. TaxID=1883156 RepID=UPI00385C3908
MEHILLLTDFSKNATNAIAYAMQFFKSKTCAFYLMYVHKVKSYVTDDLVASPKNSIHDAIVQKPKAKLDTLIVKLQNDYSSEAYQFEALIDYDVFTDAINQVVDKFEIDYVVMGSNGASNVKEFIFGSNTINVIEKVNCTTLVIPSQYKYLPVKQLLVSLQPEDALENSVFDTILDVTEAFKLHLHVLRMSLKHDDANLVFKDKERLALLDSEYYLVEGVPVDYAVSSYLQTHHIDMTAFITHEKSLLQRLFSASPSKELKSRMQLPLLVLHQN